MSAAFATIVRCASNSNDTPVPQLTFSPCTDVEGIECGNPSELAGMKRFCVAIDGNEKKVQLTRDIAEALNKAELPGVLFTARGTRCPADSEGLIFYNMKNSYGTVDKLMPNGNHRLLISHIGGGIGLEAFLREFLDKWTAANSIKTQR